MIMDIKESDKKPRGEIIPAALADWVAAPEEPVDVVWPRELPLLEPVIEEPEPELPVDDVLLAFEDEMEPVESLLAAPPVPLAVPGRIVVPSGAGTVKVEDPTTTTMDASTGTEVYWVEMMEVDSATDEPESVEPVPPVVPLAVTPGVPLAIPPDVPLTIPPGMPLSVPVAVPLAVPLPVPLPVPIPMPLAVPLAIPLPVPLVWTTAEVPPGGDVDIEPVPEITPDEEPEETVLPPVAPTDVPLDAPPLPELIALDPPVAAEEAGCVVPVPTTEFVLEVRGDVAPVLDGEFDVETSGRAVAVVLVW
jgi:hypothetical protein